MGGREMGFIYWIGLVLLEGNVGSCQYLKGGIYWLSTVVHTMQLPIGIFQQ